MQLLAHDASHASQQTSNNHIVRLQVTRLSRPPSRSQHISCMAQQQPVSGTHWASWWSQAAHALGWSSPPQSRAKPAAAALPSEPRPRILGGLNLGLLRRSAVSAAAEKGHAPAAVSPDGDAPTHLIVMVNGLFGAASNWDVICEQLKTHLDDKHTLLHPSQANSKFETYEGIDCCGGRLAQEIRDVVAAHQHLQRISIIAHSMGGLMARYAIGLCYNPVSRKICGLEPCHFVTLATPHFGCDADGVAQVPFIGWTGGLPLLGPHLFRVLQDISASTAAALFKNTGKQFFMLDSTSKQPQTTSSSSSSSDGGSSTAHLPVLFQMSQDCPDRGLYFYTALAAFKTRTCYANTAGDHLVGYANSSIRRLHELPPLPPEAATAKGVVLEDPITAAFFPQHWQQLDVDWQRRNHSDVGSNALAAAASFPPLSVATQNTLQLPYQPSKQWSSAAPAASTTARSAASSSSSKDWRELDRAQGSTSTQKCRGTSAGAIAALELEASGAAAAATSAVSNLLSPSVQQQQRQGQQADGGSGEEMMQIPGQPAAIDNREGSTVDETGAPKSSGRSSSSEMMGAAEQDLASGLASPRAAAAAAGDQRSAVEAVADAAVSDDGTIMNDRAQMVAQMLQRLQELPWRRIDVSFQGTRFGFAHNNIQVTRRWWNFEGEQVPQHLAQQIQRMEQYLNLESSNRRSQDTSRAEHTTAAAAGDQPHDDHDHQHDGHVGGAVRSEIETAGPIQMPQMPAV